MGVFQAVALIVGTTLGAGFLSGAELVRFFGAEKFLPSVLLSSTAFFCLSALFLVLGKKHGGYDGALRIFGSKGKGIKVLLSALSFIPCAGMLAGLDALSLRLAPLPSLLGLALVLCFLHRGMKGICALNSALVPILLCFVFYSAKGGLVFFYPMPERGVGMGIVYAGMNALLGAPVLLDAGKNMKRPLISAGLSAIAIAVCAICVLGVVYREGAGAIYSELPFLYAMRENRIFSLASALAILTSLGSALYPLLQITEGIGRKKVKNVAKGGILLATFVFSRLGLNGIVNIFYPAMGALGLAFSALCIFYEYLFKKRHQKIHTGGKDAEDHSRAHHEVKFKHLSAVDDEVAESRARDKIFSHNRADPRHADRDL